MKSRSPAGPVGRRKRDSDKVKRRNVSLSPELDRLVSTVVIKFGYNGFSDYVCGRLRKDAGLELAA